MDIERSCRGGDRAARPVRVVALLAIFVCLTAPPGVVPDPAAAASESPGVAELPVSTPDPVRFVLKTRQAMEEAELARSLEAGFGAVVVERLFPNMDAEGDAEGMSRMFRATLWPRGAKTGGPWETAYAIEERLDLVEAEPDLDSTLDQGPEATATCLVDDPPPDDKTWSVAAIHAVEAWKLPPPEGGRSLGEGIVVCHPDTGWTSHVELDGSRIDLERAQNLLGTGPEDGRDPLDYSGPLHNPGHGTGTGSVIISSHEVGEIFGIAPRATLVPIRTAKSVVQVFDSDLARAVNHAVDAGCHVISMSLGGRAFFGLRAAIRRAVRNDLIVAAAAGNCVRFVVAPAAYPEVLAIAGTNVQSKPWKGSSRGRAVDIAAPAEHVWTAEKRTPDAPEDGLTAGQGTSFAVATVAGSAALWLAFHDRQALVERYGDATTLQEVFRSVLAATARVPEGWASDGFGSGILDVEALLKAELPPIEESAVLALSPGEEQLVILARVVGRPAEALRPLLASLFETSEVGFEEQMDAWGPELAQMALADPDGFERLLGALSGEESGGTQEPPGVFFAAASGPLRSQLRH